MPSRHIPQSRAFIRLLLALLAVQALAMGVTEWLFDDLEGAAEEGADIVVGGLFAAPALWWAIEGPQRRLPVWQLLRLLLVAVLAQGVAIGATFVLVPGGEGQLWEEVIDICAGALISAPLLWFTLGAGEFGVAARADDGVPVGHGASPHRRVRWVLHGTLAALALLFGLAFAQVALGERLRDEERRVIALMLQQREAWHAADEAIDHRGAAAAAAHIAAAKASGEQIDALLDRHVGAQIKQHPALRTWRDMHAQWMANSIGAAQLHDMLPAAMQINADLLAEVRALRNAHAEEAAARIGRIVALGAMVLLALALGVVEPLARRVRAVHERMARQAADLERLALVAQSTGNAVVITDHHGRLEWANAALERLTGRRTGALLGQPAEQALAPEEAGTPEWEAMRRTLVAGAPVRRVLVCRHADGRRLWIDADIQPRWGEHGRQEGQIAVLTDVSESVAQRERLRTLLDTLPAGVIEVDAHGCIAEINRAAVRTLGQPREQVLGRALGTLPLQWVGDDLRPLDSGALPTGRSLAGGESLLGANLGVVDATGETRWLVMNSEPLPGGGALAGFVDVTEQRRQRTMLRVVLDSNRIGTWDWRLDTGAWDWSEQACAQLGYTRAEFAPMLPAWRERIHEDDRARVRALLRRHYDDPGVAFDTELRVLHRDGHWVWIHVAGSVVERSGDGRARRMAGIHMDISARIEQAEQTRVAGRIDALTGLHNRGALVERMQRAIDARRTDPQRHYALLFVDLDRFKQVNDTLGHSAGDELLRVLAQRLRAELRPADELTRLESEVTAARFGGDEFVIALGALRAPSDAIAVAERVLRACSQPYRLHGRDITLTASIGVVTSEWNHRDPAALLRDADIAMYEAKRLGRGRWVRFEPWMHDAIENRSSLEADLRRALHAGDIGIGLQPVMGIESDGRMVCRAVEALARWSHPSRGLVPPAHFVPLAEECGLIHELGAQVLERALALHAQWRATLGDAAPRWISVNVSVAQLGDTGFPALVEAALRRHGLSPASLQLEVTESIAAQDPQVQARMTALRAAGVRLALDDFGTGYSSLAALHQLPVDTLKIDRSFVRDIEASSYHRTLVEATVRVGHALGMQIVAEGVETVGQYELARRLGCDAVQGHLISAAMDPTAATQWLRHLQHDVARALAAAEGGPAVVAAQARLLN